MKALSIALLFCAAVFLTACKKEDPKISQLRGTWKYSETFISTGAPGQWYPVEKDYRLQFNKNGKLSGNFYVGYDRYAVEGGVLTLTNEAGTMVKYNYTLQENKLTLIPAMPSCIEGCGDRLVKID